MSDKSNASISDRYSSRYNRKFLKTLVGANVQDIEKFLNQYYNSSHYQERLESIKFLLSVRDSAKVPESLFWNALYDPCSQVKIYLLKNYDYGLKYESSKLVPHLRKLIEQEENIQVKILALEKLADLKCDECLDLFFNASLLKSNKVAAAGLKGLVMLDREKGYAMAKFKSETSTGPLDIVIAKVFSQKGDPTDLLFFKEKFAEKSPFQKIDFVPVFISYLLRLNDPQTIITNLRLISDSIAAYRHHDLIQTLILHFHQTISNSNPHGNSAIVKFLNFLIDELLEKRHHHPVHLKAIS